MSTQNVSYINIELQLYNLIRVKNFFYITFIFLSFLLIPLCIVFFSTSSMYVQSILSEVLFLTIVSILPCKTLLFPKLRCIVRVYTDVHYRSKFCLLSFELSSFSSSVQICVSTSKIVRGVDDYFDNLFFSHVHIFQTYYDSLWNQFGRECLVMQVLISDVIRKIYDTS